MLLAPLDPDHDERAIYVYGCSRPHGFTAGSLVSPSSDWRLRRLVGGLHQADMSSVIEQQDLRRHCVAGVRRAQKRRNATMTVTGFVGRVGVGGWP